MAEQGDDIGPGARSACLGGQMLSSFQPGSKLANYYGPSPIEKPNRNIYIAFAVTKEGKWTLAVMTFSNTLVDSQMGMSEKVVPDERLLHSFGLEFAILRGMINDDLEAELSRAGDAS